MEENVLAEDLCTGDYVVFTHSRRLYCRDAHSSITTERGDKAKVVNIDRHTIDIMFDDGRIAYGCSTDCMDKLQDTVSSSPDTRVWATRH